MNLGSVIRERLSQLGLEQKDLAAAAEVTESYISQLLTRKKVPPAPDRTDIYGKIEDFLKLPGGRLSRLADLERKEELKRSVVDPPPPLYKEVRELILHKCARAREGQIRAMFERAPFGAVEQLVARKLLGAAKGAIKRELKQESWLQQAARSSGCSYEQMRVKALEFLDADVFNVSVDNCVSFLEPLIESWDIDLASFRIEIVLSRRLAPGHSVRFEFVERGPDSPIDGEPGFKEFLGNRAMSGDAAEEELALLGSLRFASKRPTSLYYYRALQNLRDPLHFRQE